MIKVCIVTPSFNKAAYLEQAVRSVMGQRTGSYRLEYNILDAMSTDGSIALLHRLKQEFPDINLTVKHDRGQGDAINKSFIETDADILGWINADDLLLPGAVTRILEVFQKTGADVVYGGGMFIDKHNKVIGVYPVSAFSKEFLCSHCFLSQPSVFFTRKIYLDAGGLNKKLMYCLDYNLWIRMAKIHARFVYIPDMLSATRLHRNTKTRSGRMLFVDEILSMLNREFGQIPEEWLLYRRYRQKIERKSLRKSVLWFVHAWLCSVAGQPRLFFRLTAWALKIGFLFGVSRFRQYRVSRMSWDQKLKGF
ncbi:MAG: glycosyltransferase [Pseudomonadota bacterium]